MNIDGRDWVRAAATSEISEGSAIGRELRGLLVCLARSDGRLYAVMDQCTHQDVPLSEGEVENGAVECFMHGSRFDLATGRVLSPPAVDDVVVFPVRIEGTDVFVAVPTQAG